jgi:hypothetical protein
MLGDTGIDRVGLTARRVEEIAMGADMSTTDSPLVLQRTNTGWHATEQVPLPGAHVLRFDTYAHRAGALVTEVRVHPVDVPCFDPVPLAAVPPCTFEALAMATGHRRTRTAVARQHYRVVTAHLARVRDAAYVRLQLHEGAGPALDTALASLPPGDDIETRTATDDARASRASRATVVAALRGGFGITGEIGADHPLVAVVNGRRTFIAADRARLSQLAASRARHSWRAPGAEPSLDLQHAHRQYADRCQHERTDVALMAALGHPHAPCYRRLRRFFDRLAFACGANTRRVAYIGDHEHADYMGPALDLARYPTGFAQFGQVAPGGADWRAYIEQAAASGWPDGCEPRLDGGAWHVYTQRVELREALAALRSDPEDGTQPIRVAGASVTVRLGQGRAALALHAQVLRLVRIHQRDGLLPARAGSA